MADDQIDVAPPPPAPDDPPPDYIPPGPPPPDPPARSGICDWQMRHLWSLNLFHGYDGDNAAYFNTITVWTEPTMPTSWRLDGGAWVEIALNDALTLVMTDATVTVTYLAIDEFNNVTLRVDPASEFDQVTVG